MNQDKKGMLNHQFSCEICEISFMSNAEYALHEFTKKHCDNLIRVAKNKPILKKQKTKNKSLEVEKEAVKVNTVTHPGSFDKYGYFIPVELHAVANPKEFNADYDPYLQKFAESSYKEETTPLIKEEFQESHTKVVTPVARTPKKKKKNKNNIKMCNICNVALLTTPSYMAHMKSAEHILKLKVSGMGVSAHFVKSSSDLHTIKAEEDQKVCQDLISLNEKSNQQNSSSAFPLLNSNNSEPALHSSDQYTASVAEKHADKFIINTGGNKIELSKTEKLFCYTCNKALNTLYQYNEHKNGRKHKSKCKILIKKGMTVPPEERVTGIDILNNDTGQPVYPPRYVMMIAERQKISGCPTIEHGIGSSNTNSILELHKKPDLCDQNIRLTNFDKKSGDDMVPTGIQDEVNSEAEVSKPFPSYELVKKPNLTFHKINEEQNSENSSTANKGFYTSKTTEAGNMNEDSENKIIVLSSEESLCCSICNEHFQLHSQFHMHLTKEEHLKKIVELKVSGKSNQEILDLIFADRNFIKPNNVGKLLCSICSITANNELELKQHLSCVFHKYMKRDYKNKTTLEVKELIPCDETGMYYCKLCRIKLTSLVEFSHHIFSAEHSSIKKKRVTFGSATLSQSQRFGQNLKRKANENPEEKKTCDPQTDLCTGAESKVPGVKFLDSKIEPTKNVSIGFEGKLDSFKDRNKLGTSNKSRQQWFNSDVQVQRQSLMQPNSCRLRPSLASRNFFPPKNYLCFSNRLPYNNYHARGRNAPPFYNSHPFEFRPFF